MVSLMLGEKIQMKKSSHVSCTVIVPNKKYSCWLNPLEKYSWVPNSRLYLIHTTGCKILYTTDMLPIVPICLTFIVRETIQNFPIQRCRWRDFRRTHPSCFVRLEQPVLSSVRFSESLRGVVFGRINHYVKEFWLVFRSLLSSFIWKDFAMKLCFLLGKIFANTVWMLTKLYKDMLWENLSCTTRRQISCWTSLNFWKQTKVSEKFKHVLEDRQ